MSETADRWWVRLAARWLARVDGVSGQIRLAMLVMTGLSTATLSLRQYGLGEYAPALIAATGVGLAMFAYAYTEGGVWNQMARDRSDLSSNHATPRAKINTELTGVAMVAALEGREPDADERAAVKAAVDAQWRERRDGVPLTDGGETPTIECPTCGAGVGIVYRGACVECGDAATRETIRELRPEGEDG